MTYLLEETITNKIVDGRLLGLLIDNFVGRCSWICWKYVVEKLSAGGGLIDVVLFV